MNNDHAMTIANDAFGNAALSLNQHGLAVIPLGGSDGKKPLLAWGTWRHRPGSKFLTELIQRYADANVGVVTQLSGVTVVDIDDPKLIDPMIRRFGDTPLKIGTPSGGVHLWYRMNGERCGTYALTTACPWM